MGVNNWPAAACYAGHGGALQALPGPWCGLSMTDGRGGRAQWPKKLMVESPSAAAEPPFWHRTPIVAGQTRPACQTGWSLVQIRPGEPLPNWAFDIACLFPRIDKPCAGLVTACSQFHLSHCRRGEPLPACGLRVTLDLLQSRVAGDGGDLVRRATVFS